MHHCRQFWQRPTAPTISPCAAEHLPGLGTLRHHERSCGDIPPVHGHDEWHRWRHGVSGRHGDRPKPRLLCRTTLNSQKQLPHRPLQLGGSCPELECVQLLRDQQCYQLGSTPSAAGHFLAPHLGKSELRAGLLCSFCIHGAARLVFIARSSISHPSVHPNRERRLGIGQRCQWQILGSPSGPRHSHFPSGSGPSAVRCLSAHILGYFAAGLSSGGFAGHR